MDGWVAFNGSCYLFGHDNVHFTEAEVSNVVLSCIIYTLFKVTAASTLRDD